MNVIKLRCMENMKIMPTHDRIKGEITMKNNFVRSCESTEEWQNLDDDEEKQGKVDEAERHKKVNLVCPAGNGRTIKANNFVMRNKVV